MKEIFLTASSATIAVLYKNRLDSPQLYYEKFFAYYLWYNDGMYVTALKVSLKLTFGITMKSVKFLFFCFPVIRI
jgi:hypothetical protein